MGLGSQTWFLLAEAAKTTKDAPPAPGFASMLPAIVGIFFLFYFLILRPQKSKEQQFRTLIDNLKETDRVVTIGGIHGVVTNVQREAGVLTIRVDEATGAKIRINASAVARVVTDEEKTG
jgi:preprotein translocase subunit YajC